MVTIRKVSVLYTWMFPVLLVCGDAMMVMRGAKLYEWLPSNIVAWGLWVLSVFYLYPKQGIPRFPCEREERKLLDKLFLAKLRPGS